MANKIREVAEFKGAMENLSAIASIDLNNPPSIGILEGHRLVTHAEEFDQVEWLSGEGTEELFEILDWTYGVIYRHLVDLSQNVKVDWESEKNQKGVCAIMELVGESAAKIEALMAIRLGHPLTEKLTSRPAYKDLQNFYKEKFASQMAPQEAAIVETAHLKNWDEVVRDREYELFYIRDEEGRPYFNPELLRHVKVACDFEGDSFEEDPLLKVRAMRDRDILASAGQILMECHALTVEFYKNYTKWENNSFVQLLSEATMALFLAGNPSHLLTHTTGKSCLQYFADFQIFLREALVSPEYQKLIAYPPDSKDKLSQLLLHLVHSLCRLLFVRAGGVKQESIGLIHRTMRKGEEEKQKGKKTILKGETLWDQLAIDDEKFRTHLSKFPNGPLFQILDLVREPEAVPFDPLLQQNLPSRLYGMEVRGHRIDLLRLPCPTTQALINKAEIVGEFRGFLRSLKPKERHLMVNFQDRTSWIELARNRALEGIQKNAEFGSKFFLMTLPKNSDFYYQIAEYAELNNATDFIATFQAQLNSPEECGFLLPLSQKEVRAFAEKILPAVHKHYFRNKNAMTRGEREDFIEIVYQYLILKAIDTFEPSTLSFVCKDGVDTSAAEQGAFFGFLQLLSGDLNEKGSQDFLRWLLYSPALFIRERAIDPERLNRTLSLLQRLCEGDKLSDGFQPQTLKSLKILLS